MPDYFYMEPQGKGTPEIENFYSFVGRLANAHAVTIYQLVEHMNAWTGVPRDLRIAKHGFFTSNHALCGTGVLVKHAVEILELAVGYKGLRATTFLALAEATCRNAPQIVKRQRAWCPACYIDSVRTQTVLYDRLYWASALISRCIEHKISLESRCPKCHRHQKVSGLAHAIDKCIWCKGSLISSHKHWNRAPYPSFGEAEVLELISRVVLDPGIVFERNVAQRFFSSLRSRQVDALFGATDLRLYRIDPAHLRTESPKFVTLLRCAAAFDISLVGLLENPEEAALQVTATLVKRPPVPFQPRLRHDDAVRHSVGRALVHAIRESRAGRVFSLRMVCETLGVTKGYAAYQFPQLCSQLVNKRSVLIEKLVAVRRKTLQAALEGGLLKRYQAGELHSIDHLVGEMVRLYGVSHSMARTEVNDFLYSARKNARKRRRAEAARARKCQKLSQTKVTA